MFILLIIVARVACSPVGREVSVLLPGVEQSASVCRLLKRTINVVFNSEVCKYDSFRISSTFQRLNMTLAVAGAFLDF